MTDHELIFFISAAVADVTSWPRKSADLVQASGMIPCLQLGWRKKSTTVVDVWTRSAAVLTLLFGVLFADQFFSSSPVYPLHDSSSLRVAPKSFSTNYGIAFSFLFSNRIPPTMHSWWCCCCNCHCSLVYPPHSSRAPFRSRYAHYILLHCPSFPDSRLLFIPFAWKHTQ